jgi:hypothetical protein
MSSFEAFRDLWHGTRQAAMAFSRERGSILLELLQVKHARTTEFVAFYGVDSHSAHIVDLVHYS